MNTKLNLYCLRLPNGSFMLPFPAINDHFATMAVADVPDVKGCTLFRCGSYNTETGRVFGRIRLHEVR